MYYTTGKLCAVLYRKLNKLTESYEKVNYMFSL